MAGRRLHQARLGEAVAMAGHSLGEFSALVAAGALSEDDALRLDVLRGRLMADAAAEAGEDGAMVALLGGDAADAERLAHEHGFVLANDNAPGQVVLSGPRAGLDTLQQVARADGFKALALDVTGAFHYPAVAAAREPLHAALRAVEWTRPMTTVVSGLTAAPFTDPARELADALISPVRWRQTMATLFELRAHEFVDAGPGRVLERLVARNLPALEQHALTG
jgi:[acyl-carrier-protein] S-malonyltransferase